MRTVCDVCNKKGVRIRHTKISSLHICRHCGSYVSYYYRKDGHPFGYPPAWGKVLAVLATQEGVMEVPEEDKPLVGADYVLEGNFYYLFQSDDGTIRRARIDSLPFTDQKPPTLPPTIEAYHYWNVDVLPASPG
jgi:hypothetical protein